MPAKNIEMTYWLSLIRRTSKSRAISGSAGSIASIDRATSEMISAISTTNSTGPGWPRAAEQWVSSGGLSLAGKVRVRPTTHANRAVRAKRGKLPGRGNRLRDAGSLDPGKAEAFEVLRRRLGQQVNRAIVFLRGPLEQVQRDASREPARTVGPVDHDRAQ